MKYSSQFAHSLKSPIQWFWPCFAFLLNLLYFNLKVRGRSRKLHIAKYYHCFVQLNKKAKAAIDVDINVKNKILSHGDLMFHQTNLSWSHLSSLQHGSQWSRHTVEKKNDWWILSCIELSNNFIQIYGITIVRDEDKVYEASLSHMLKACVFGASIQP